MVTLGVHRWFTLRELAEQSRMSWRAVWRLVRTGQVPAKWLAGKWHIRSDTWERWCASEDSVVRRNR